MEQEAPGSIALPRQSSHSIHLLGTLESDPQFYPTQNGGERGWARIRVTEPSFTFSRDGRETVVPEKNHYYSASVLGKEAVAALRAMKAGDRIDGRGSVEPFTPRGSNRPELQPKLFAVAPTNATRDVNEVRLAGEITESRFRANRGNAQLDSVDYTVKAFGKDGMTFAVREFGQAAREIDAAGDRAGGTRIDLEGRLSMASFPGRNGGKVEMWFVSTTPREVTLPDRAQTNELTQTQERAPLSGIAGVSFDADALLDEYEAQRATVAAEVPSPVTADEVSQQLREIAQLSVSDNVDDWPAVVAERIEATKTYLEARGVDSRAASGAIDGFHAAIDGELSNADAAWSTPAYGEVAGRLERYARAAGELATTTLPTDLSPKQREGIISSLKENAYSLTTSPRALPGLTNEALVEEYLSSGAAVVDRADAIAERDAHELERTQEQEHAVEAELELAEEAGLGLG